MSSLRTAGEIDIQLRMISVLSTRVSKSVRHMFSVEADPVSVRPRFLQDSAWVILE